MQTQLYGKEKKNSYFELDVYNVLQNTYLFIYLRKKIPKCKVFVFGMYEIEILQLLDAPWCWVTVKYKSNTGFSFLF